MKQTLLPVLIHTLEALVVVTGAIVLAQFFPEHRGEVGIVAVTAFSALFKYVRIAPAVPVPDYVNDQK